MFGKDQTLTSLADLSVDGLKKTLAGNIDTSQLDTDITDYSICNIRYKPNSKMVLGLTAPDSQRPIAIRIYPPGSLKKHLNKAREYHPNQVFPLPELNGIAWVFPAERKLQLGMIADQNLLAKIFRQHCSLDFKKVNLERFVAEHTYTARVESNTSEGLSSTNYLKVHFNHAGAHTAKMMVELEQKLAGGPLEVPTEVQYLPEYKMLLQRALPRKKETIVSDHEVARVLAKVHGLRISSAVYAKSPPPSLLIEQIASLLTMVFPAWLDTIYSLWHEICNRLSSLSSRLVCIHGDVHLGNIFPLTNGNIGLIDFDSFALGEAEQDLCGYFAFKLGHELRKDQELSTFLATFPEFIEDYNCHARYSVSLSRSYLLLAQKMLSERIHRGLARGKFNDENEFARCVEIAELCLVAA